MPRFSLSLRMDNAAFEDSPLTELVRILRKLADDIDQGDFAMESKRLRDINGNTVGAASFEGD